MSSSNGFSATLMFFRTIPSRLWIMPLMSLLLSGIPAPDAQAGWLFGSSAPKCGDSDILSEIENQIRKGVENDAPPAQLDFMRVRGRLYVEISFGVQRERERYDKELQRRYCETEVEVTPRLKDFRDDGSPASEEQKLMFAANGVVLNKPMKLTLRYDLVKNDDGSFSILKHGF